MRVYSIPMRTRLRGIARREGVLINGPSGWGEFSPFPDCGPAESARWLAAAREAAYQGWPAPLRDRVPVNAIVPAVGPAEAHEITSTAGCRTAKVKVAEPGQTDDDDLARVEAVRDAIGPGGRIRVDANGAWDVDHAARMIRTLDRFELEFAEQPCASLEELADVRRRVDVPIAADESVRRADDPVKVRALGAADIVVLKAQPLGGVRAGLRIAEQCGLPVVVSSALETSVGLAAGLALAAALPELPYACGLATLSLLDGDVAVDPLLPEDGELPVRRPRPEERSLGGHEVDGREWRRRVAEAQALLDDPPVIGVVR
ncbi:o-succinylbenzoate synthase [Actinomadura alba]|uniref:o-succinylbenzoate synthase n=1 Tax=Actinomadura alba TaxID=406431 RepID=UPI003381D485